jgi:hypothetical protein
MSDEQVNYSSPLPSVIEIDGKERVLEFLARHGGAAPDVEHEGVSSEGTAGWSEVHAADGYRMRCEWSEIGSTRHMSFVEIAPGRSQ